MLIIRIKLDSAFQNFQRSFIHAFSNVDGDVDNVEKNTQEFLNNYNSLIDVRNLYDQPVIDSV